MIGLTALLTLAAVLDHNWFAASLTGLATIHLALVSKS